MCVMIAREISGERARWSHLTADARLRLPEMIAKRGDLSHQRVVQFIGGNPHLCSGQAVSVLQRESSEYCVISIRLRYGYRSNRTE